MTTDTEVTNEQIALMLGWERATGNLDGMWWEPVPTSDGVRACVALPDYLHDPGTLGEAEAYCREHGWMFSISINPNFVVGVVIAIGNGEVVRAAADSIIEALWTAIVSARTQELHQIREREAACSMTEQGELRAQLITMLERYRDGETGTNATAIAIEELVTKRVAQAVEPCTDCQQVHPFHTGPPSPGEMSRVIR